MPISDPANIAPIVHELQRLQPKSVLDLGIGKGLYGALIRNYLGDSVTLFGVEGFGEYRNPLWACYHHITVENLLQGTQQYTTFDVVLILDVLEHLGKHVAYELLKYLMEHNKHVIISVPLGFYPQGAVNGNELETHRATWTMDDLDKFPGTMLHRGVCGVKSCYQR